MQVIVVSPDTIAPSGTVNTQVVAALVALQAAGHPVGIVSNHAQPSWFATHFNGTNASFVREIGRQSGAIIGRAAAQFGVQAHDVIVLASNDVDIQMGKNGRAVLVAASWCATPRVAALGIDAKTPAQFQEIVQWLDGWSGRWWFAANHAQYNTRALSDLSGYGKPLDQQEFAARLTNTVKSGGSRLNALLVLTARSLIMDGIDQESDLVWGVFPASSSKNDDSDTLCDFTHRLRTTVSRVRFAQRGEPLFIRHIPSVKRSSAPGVDRNDPSGQVTTLHINPAYRGRIVGKHVIVVDDCTTYGLSFGVASAFLRKAGARKVTGIALGKFGNRFQHFDIAILTDPFAPVAAAGFRLNSTRADAGVQSAVSQQVLQRLIS